MELFANDIKLPFGDSLILKFLNPMFNNIGSYSFPLSFPAKFPMVCKAFGFPGSLESEKAGTIFARIKTDNIELRGEWEVTEANETTIEAYFKGGSGSFNKAISGEYLTDLTYNGKTYPAGSVATREEVLAHMTSTMNSFFPESDYTAFCAYMPFALGEETPADMKFVNPISWLSDNIDFIIPASGRLNSSVYLFAGAVLEYIFSEHGYRIERNVFRNDFDLRQLVLFNNFNQNGYREFNYQNFVPKKTVKEFMTSLQLRFNIGFFIDEEKRSVVIEKFDNVVSSVENTNLKLIGKKSSFKNISGIKLLSQPTDPWTTNSYTRISEFPGDYLNITEVNGFRNIVPGEATVNKIYYVLNEDAYYVVKVIEGPDGYEVQRICTNQLPYYEGTDPEARGPAGEFPGMYNHREVFAYQYHGIDYSGTADWMLPRCDLACNFKESTYDWLTRDPLDYIDFPIMFVFARGICPVDIYEDADIGNPGATRKARINMPFGSVTAYDATGTLNYPYTSLCWDGIYGIVNLRWGNRLNWELVSKKDVKAGIYGSDMRKLFQFFKALNIENSNYLVNSFTLEINGKFTKVSEAELYRL